MRSKMSEYYLVVHQYLERVRSRVDLGGSNWIVYLIAVHGRFVDLNVAADYNFSLRRDVDAVALLVLVETDKDSFFRFSIDLRSVFIRDEDESS